MPQRLEIHRHQCGDDERRTTLPGRHPDATGQAATSQLRKMRPLEEWAVVGRTQAPQPYFPATIKLQQKNIGSLGNYVKS
jgi:hypothetical protein